MKRAFDVALAGAGLLISLPLWLVFGAAIKLEDGGPVFYSQPRVGFRGRIFEALKFRSMRANAESGVGAVQAVENDPRVTRVGRFMRRTAMDELPQLWNIFRGDMSFVGPRALRPGEVDTSGTNLDPDRSDSWLRGADRGTSRADRNRPDLRAPRRAATTEVQVRPDLRASSVDVARSAFDSAVVLD